MNSGNRSMSLPFLSGDEQREFELRIARALEPEEKRHVRTKGEKTQDVIDRRLLQSTVHVTNLIGEGLEHLRNVGGILRAELLKIVERKGLRLGAKEVALISGTLRERFQPCVAKLNTEIDAAVRDWGNHLNLTPTARSKFEAQIGRECDDEVILRVTEMHRKQTGDRRKWLSERIEKLTWAIVGAILGVSGTLLTQWVRGR